MKAVTLKKYTVTSFLSKKQELLHEGKTFINTLHIKNEMQESSFLHLINIVKLNQTRYGRTKLI